MSAGPLFAFDLDGTLTLAEILPALAREAGIFAEMRRLTTLTLDGELDFEPSFRQRFALLRHLPLATAARVVAAIPLDPLITAFIAEHRESCAIVTGNLDRWIAPLTAPLGCPVHCSRSAIRNGELVLESVLDKGRAVAAMKKTGRPVIAIGDAANDIPMFRAADAAIAYASLRTAPQKVAAAAGRVVCEPAALCSLLREMAAKPVLPSGRLL